MASAKKAKEVVESKYPSNFGSHKSMIDATMTEKIQKVDPSLCVCRDDKGAYVTQVKILDNNLADLDGRCKINEFRNPILKKYGFPANVSRDSEEEKK